MLLGITVVVEVLLEETCVGVTNIEVEGPEDI